MNKLKEWDVFFEKKRMSIEQRKILLDYVSSLLSNNVPIILEFRHLSYLLGFEPKDLANITIKNESSYRSFKIPKKRGGFRLIESPYPDLAHAQKWIYKNILKDLAISDYCYAYTKNKNIVKNANAHLNSSELLKLDIRDFFGSINLNRVMLIFKELGYTNLLSFHLAKICTYRNHLPQGACTSPALSNIICRELDKKLINLAKSMGLNYSRYADDITFSGNFIPIEMIDRVTSLLSENGFSVNTKKTILKKGTQRKVVTGLLVSGNKVRVLKKYRRQFRQDVYYFFKSIDNGKVPDCFQKDPLYIDRLVGRANHILTVEPSNIHAKESLLRLTNFKKNIVDRNSGIESRITNDNT